MWGGGLCRQPVDGHTKLTNHRAYVSVRRPRLRTPDRTRRADRLARSNYPDFACGGLSHVCAG